MEEQDGPNSPWQRSYACMFCKRGFSSAQALGGHMNVHRRDRALLRQVSGSSSSSASPPVPSRQFSFPSGYNSSYAPPSPNPSAPCHGASGALYHVAAENSGMPRFSSSWSHPRNPYHHNTTSLIRTDQHYQGALGGHGRTPGNYLDRVGGTREGQQDDENIEIDHGLDLELRLGEKP